ncbi:MAG TPA: 4Fe-4S ferredoxin [Firmicutes bacterium]|nr:4Fe-4S ferredoxin [Bacillota bacterium]
MNIKEDLQKLVGELMEKGEIGCFIGYKKGRLAFHSPPVFIDDPHKVDRLIWDQYCIANLSKYLINEFPEGSGRIGLLLKGCDSRGLVTLMKDNQVKRENVVIVGVRCPGMKNPLAAFGAADLESVPLAEKCLSCTHPAPVIYDYLLGEETQRQMQDRFTEVEELERRSFDERYAFWSGNITRCIRCYACRNACPVCSCKDCYAEQRWVKWHGKGAMMGDNANFLLTRALHVAGRCTECGECERVCPMQLPLMAINKKLIKETQELFQSGDAGLSQDEELPLCSYSLNDPDEFL